jgi:hypothetical protein
MRPWSWILLWPLPLMAGCLVARAAPVPPIDAAAPARTETATFALG